MDIRTSRKKEAKQKKSGRLRTTQAKKEAQAGSIVLKKFAISRRWRYRNCLRAILLGSSPEHGTDAVTENVKRGVHSKCQEGSA